jgi:hypothetical protein
MRSFASRITNGMPRRAKWYPTAQSRLSAADDDGVESLPFDERRAIRCCHLNYSAK